MDQMTKGESRSMPEHAATAAGCSAALDVTARDVLEVIARKTMDAGAMAALAAAGLRALDAVTEPRQWHLVMSTWPGRDTATFLFREGVDAVSREDALRRAQAMCVRMFAGTVLEDWHEEGDDKPFRPEPEAPRLADPNDLSADDRATLAAYYAERRQEEATFERGFRIGVRARNARRGGA